MIIFDKKNMKRAIVINEAGTTKFTESMNRWLAENPNATIISISYSTQNVSMPMQDGRTMYANDQSALIVYES